MIEHVFNPISTLLMAHRKLRVGGSLILIVPEMTRTFDRMRALTTIEHLLLDYNKPDKNRDREHYEEFYSLAFNDLGSRVKNMADQAFRERGDLHTHVWTYNSFGDFISYINDNFVTWSEIQSFPARSDLKNDIEFYYKLIK